jgi:beta-lactam-binding protein with PASTA domain
VGRQLAEAKEKIVRAGLQVPIVAAAVSANQGAAVANAPVNPGAPAATPFSGIIVSQTPPAGSRVTPETQIRLEVSQ